MNGQLDPIALMKTINELEYKISALATIQIGGIWTSYTPSITYSGGTTDPTSLTISSSRYSVVGKICHLNIVATLVRGSGDRTQTQFTLPINYNAQFCGSALVAYVSGSNAWRVYGNSSTKIHIDHGAMTGDGVIYVSAFYQIA